MPSTCSPPHTPRPSTRETSARTTWPTPGGSAASHSFSFDLPAGPQKFAIDIHDVPQGLATPSGSAYTLSVTGACLGACNPPNRVPVAKARNVVVAAGDACGAAAASIDDGSSDEDGDALTITQSPAGPYMPGTTAVLLTVVDPGGATSQATATVTVVDQTPPAISCPAPITVPTSPGACSAPVTFTTTASDTCSPIATGHLDACVGVDLRGRRLDGHVDRDG